jgi:DNA-binding winged helix-turn-helix (wHTH) protein
VLRALVERRGEFVTREELRARLWPGDIFVEFDDSLSHAVKKLRQALGDNSESSRYIETLPRRGYRFIAPVENFVAPASPPAVDAAPVPTGCPKAKLLERPQGGGLYWRREPWWAHWRYFWL